MARRAARTDANHKSIKQFFRAHGCEVESLAPLGMGVADLLVGAGFYWRRGLLGRVALVEVKSKGGRLTPKELRFASRFPVWTVRTEAQALEVIQWLKHGT